MTSFKQTEAEFPELRDLPTFSAAWYARWRDLHLAKYPDVDQGTRDNLAMFVERAAEQERSLARFVGRPEAP